MKQFIWQQHYTISEKHLKHWPTVLPYHCLEGFHRETNQWRQIICSLGVYKIFLQLKNSHLRINIEFYESRPDFNSFLCTEQSIKIFFKLFKVEKVISWCLSVKPLEYNASLISDLSLITVIQQNFLSEQTSFSHDVSPQCLSSYLLRLKIAPDKSQLPQRINL